MNIKAIPIILGVVILALLAIFIFVPGKNREPASPTPNATSTPTSTTGGGGSTIIYYDYTSAKGKIVKASIAPNQKITNPVTFTGNVPAGWAFEASFPAWVVPYNSDVKLGYSHATVPNWMSTTTAWYSVTISFTKPTTATGAIILANDNPSGDMERGDNVIIPITF